jgi:general secretion pathway protein D
LNVFEVLTKLTGVNFIFDKDMTESKVTLFMTDVSFDRFLEVLLRTNKLSGQVADENTMIIYPDTPAKAKEYQDLQIRTFYLSFIDVKKAVALLAKILKSKDIIANEKLNAVVIRGPRDVIEIASKVIAANDRETAEVMLNVEILEVTRTKERQLGVDYNPMSVTLGLGESTERVLEGKDFVNNASLYALKNLSSKEVLLSIPTATLNLLRQDTDTRILANPQIRVKNGEKATIHIGERVPLRVNRRIDTTGVVTNDFQYTDIGVKLDTEPIINVHDEITLKLNLEKSALGPNLATPEEPEFAILTRNVNTVLTVRDGEPVILGGLISETERSTTRKVPLLGEVPMLGHLFSNLDSNVEDTDILMAITPVVIRSQEIPQSDVTRIWSGTEEGFSLRKPYEIQAEEKGQYLDQLRDVSLESPSDPDDVKVEDTDRFPETDEDAAIFDPETGKQIEDDEGHEDFQDDSPESLRSQKDAPFGREQEDTLELQPEAVEEAKMASDSTGEEILWDPSFPFTIHVASYKDKKEADERIRRLTRDGYECFAVYTDVAGKGFFYRIFVGRFRNKGVADVFCDELKTKKGFARDIHVVTRGWAYGG